MRLRGEYIHPFLYWKLYSDGMFRFRIIDQRGYAVVSIILWNLFFVVPRFPFLLSVSDSYLNRVILGSFSNYLVTKSSVPVMVARKRLRKHGKYKRPAVRLANNLTNVSGRNLATAKID